MGEKTRRSKVGVFQKTFLLIGIYTIANACEGDREALIRGYIDERVSDFERTERRRCRESLIDRAAAVADSTLLTEATLEAQDTQLLNRPWKPGQPPPIEPLDSGEVKPIFDQEEDR